MPPRKTKQASRTSRQSTQFGELDTTPTSRASQSPQRAPVSSGWQNRPSKQQESQVKGDPSVSMQPTAHNGGSTNLLDNEDLTDFVPDALQEHAADGGLTSWSDAGSLARPSSPLLAVATPQDCWQFDEDSPSPQLSSAPSGRDDLPDTMPLPLPLPPGPVEMQKRVDFSETASTVHRSSSSPAEGNPTQSIWDFPDTGSTAEPAFEAEGTNPAMRLQKRKLANIIDSELQSDVDQPSSTADRKPAESILAHQPAASATKEVPAETQATLDEGPPENTKKARKPRRKRKKQAKSPIQLPIIQLDEATDEDKELPKAQDVRTGAHQGVDPSSLTSFLQVPSSPAPKPKGGNSLSCSKRKQRAKPPIQFDEATQEVKEPPQAQAAGPGVAPARTPVVTDPMDSFEPSSTPMQAVIMLPIRPKDIKKMTIRRKVPVDTQTRINEPPLPRHHLQEKAREAERDVTGPQRHTNRAPPDPEGSSIVLSSDSDEGLVPDVSSSPVPPAGTVDTTMANHDLEDHPTLGQTREDCDATLSRHSQGYHKYIAREVLARKVKLSPERVTVMTYGSPVRGLGDEAILNNSDSPETEGGMAYQRRLWFDKGSHPSSTNPINHLDASGGVEGPSDKTKTSLEGNKEPSTKVPSKKQHKRKPKRAVPSEFENLTKEIHERILDLLGQEGVLEKFQESLKAKDENSYRPEDDPVSIMLRKIVGDQIDHLESKAAAVHETPRVYLKNGLGCVRKIRGKQKDELLALQQLMKLEMETFTLATDEAAAQVDTTREKLQSTMEAYQKSREGRRVIVQDRYVSLRQKMADLQEHFKREDERIRSLRSNRSM